MRKANQANADEFAGRVAAIIPRGDPSNGNLVDTLVVRPGEESETAVLVSIGGPGHIYPLHLEAGHRSKDGTHVPAKPFWNPAKRVMRKRARSRGARALSKAVKIAQAAR